MARRYPKLVYHMVCDDMREEAGNKVSFMGIYRGDIVLPIPSVFPKLCFHLAFTGIRNGDKCTIQFLDPKDKPLFNIESPPFELRKKSPPRLVLLDVVCAGITISQEGNYRLFIAFGEDDRAKQDFKIKFKKKE